MFEFITKPIFLIFDSTLGLFFHIFRDNQPANVLFGIFVVSAIVSALIVVITAKVIDQKKMKKLKAKMSKIQDKLKEAQKKGDAKEMKKIQSKMMKNSSEMWQMSMKPMLYTMLPIILVFTWLKEYEYLATFVEHQEGYVVALPFILPKFGDKLGWLGWYILSSFATSPLIKKLFKIEGP
ncbi:MAG: EMC3/TMCO1 family protein [Candidatus Hydrothermarchaeales archaeon]